jgi:hypothetical protein
MRQIRISVTSPAIASHAANQPSQSGASIGGRAAAHGGVLCVAFESHLVLHLCLTDTQFQALQGHFEARLEAETKTLSSRIDGAAKSGIVTTVTVAIVVAAFQTVAVIILVITRRKSSATASCVVCNKK